MTPYYIKEIHFKDGNIEIVVGDLNKEEWEVRLKLRADEIVNKIGSLKDRFDYTE